MLVKFKYTKDHGTSKKGLEVDMHVSTAKALAAHKIGKFNEPEEVAVEEPKGEAKPITSK